MVPIMTFCLTDERDHDDGQVPSLPPSPKTTINSSIVTEAPDVENLVPNDSSEVPDHDDSTLALKEDGLNQATEKESESEHRVSTLDVTDPHLKKKVTETDKTEAEDSGDRPPLCDHVDSGYPPSTSSSHDILQEEIDKLTTQLHESQLLAERLKNEVKETKEELQGRDQMIVKLNEDLEVAKYSLPDLSPNPDFCLAFWKDTFMPCKNQPKEGAMMCVDHINFPLFISSLDKDKKKRIYCFPDNYEIPTKFKYAMGRKYLKKDREEKQIPKGTKCYLGGCGRDAKVIICDGPEDEPTPLCEYHDDEKPLSSCIPELYGGIVYGRLFPEHGIYDHLPAGRLIRQRYRHSSPVTAKDYIGYLYAYVPNSRRNQHEKQNSAENRKWNLVKIGLATDLSSRKRQHEYACEKDIEVLKNFSPFVEDTTAIKEIKKGKEIRKGMPCRYAGLFEGLLHGMFVRAKVYDCPVKCGKKHTEWFHFGKYDPEWSITAVIERGDGLVKRLMEFYPVPENSKSGPGKSYLAPKDRIFYFDYLELFAQIEE
ncbi:hypothetical protein EMPS_09859 [Entomortierella parvispora]|uniref:Bacteriophage T5 Orf172 DNA-binding domain-containing protein n=1 Tax=Entomortierella parvispora TaxID=205924 RepID=A0A9P3M100_9FUNG|nr:hypothetical protein EMPS_09859 [Entomortierella parvispora]